MKKRKTTKTTDLELKSELVICLDGEMEMLIKCIFNLKKFRSKRF